jgi:hypothetical protein
MSSKNHPASNSKHANSDLNDSKLIPRERAKTAVSRHRAPSSHYDSLIYNEDEYEEEELQRKLAEYEQKL